MAKPIVGEPDWGAILNDFLDTLLARAANLSDLESVSTARTNLELGTAATRNVEAFAPSDATGPPGPAGPAGANGANGLNGLNGNDGEDGADGSLGYLDITEDLAPGYPATGDVRLYVVSAEGNDPAEPPELFMVNFDEQSVKLLTQSEADQYYLPAAALNGAVPGTLMTRDVNEPNYPGFLPPGTNGQVLTADDTEPLGLKWVTP